MKWFLLCGRCRLWELSVHSSLQGMIKMFSVPWLILRQAAYTEFHTESSELQNGVCKEANVIHFIRQVMVL